MFTRARSASCITCRRQAPGRGDKMIIFLNNNEQFLDGFWAAICGGIVPVPLAVGISDEHRHKLLRVARKLGNPLLYTDAKTLERLEALAGEVGESELFAQLKSRAFLVESITDISKAGKLVRPAPEDLAFIQFSSGSTSEPKGVMLTHGNLMANTRGATAVGKYNDAGHFLELDAADARHGSDRLLPDAIRQPRAHQSHADRTIRAPAACCGCRPPPKSASPSPVRRTSATGIFSKCWAIGGSRTPICHRSVRSTTAPSRFQSACATNS